MASLRDGRWLTADRLAIYPAILLGLFGLALVVLFATAHGLLDALGRPIGTDFSQIWIAGREVAAGHPAAVYDNGAHAAAQAAVFGPSEGFYTWPYPPYFLAVAALCATLPYLPALLAWQAATLPLYLGAIAHLARAAGRPRRAMLLAALAFPPVAINLLHGHNGFLTAGLLTWGLILLPRRPAVAGALFALLAYKPQFALALPVALVAGGAWTSIAAAGASFAALTLATTAAFGTTPWRAFFAGADVTRTVVLEAGAAGFEKIQTIFAAVRLLGGSVALAYGAQGLVAAGVLASLAWLWRTGRDRATCGAALLTATLLTTPYALDYDEVVLGPALALMVLRGRREGFAPFELTIMALAWSMPLLARPLGGVGLPLGPIVILGFYASLVRHGVRGASTHEANLPLA